MQIITESNNRETKEHAVALASGSRAYTDSFRKNRISD